MLNLLGINVTENDETDVFPGDAFIVRQAGAGHYAAAAELHSQFADAVEHWQPETAAPAQNSKPGLPPLYGLLKTTCLFGAVMMLSSLIRGGHIERYRDAPAEYWIGGICFLGWLLLFLRDRALRKQAEETVRETPVSELAEVLDRIKQLAEQAKKEMGIPDSAIGIDVLGEQYVTKNGVPKHISAEDGGEYLNLERYAYVQDGSLFLANAAEVMEIPLASLRSMRYMDRRYSFADWNKSEPHNAKKYRRCKVQLSGGVYSAHCFQIDIADARGSFYLLIPDYEAEAFSALTGLHPDK